MTNTNTNNNTYKSSIRDKSSPSPKIKQYATINDNNDNNRQQFTSTYKTNQKFSDYYPMFTPPIATLNLPQAQNVNLNVTRSNSCISSGTKSANSTLRQSQTFQALKHQPPVKANIRDTQWIKENILRNLKTRKPLAAAASVLNANSANSAATTESLVSTVSSYLLTPPSTVKPSTESHAHTPPSALKMHPSSLFRHSNGNQRSSEGTKKVEFVNINENNNTNLNSFQRLCELASRWNNKNRLVATQVLKIREKKYLSNSTNNFGDKLKIKKHKKHFKAERSEVEEVEFNTPSSRNNNDNSNSKSYTKVIAKNFIQLRPVNENVSFTNIHYAFSTSTSGPKTPPLHIPPLITTPTLNTATQQTVAPPSPDQSSISPNSIKWINNSKNLIGNLQPLHVS